jgi:hypothetical protein
VYRSVEFFGAQRPQLFALCFVKNQKAASVPQKKGGFLIFAKKKRRRQ